MIEKELKKIEVEDICLGSVLQTYSDIKTKEEGVWTTKYYTLTTIYPFKGIKDEVVEDMNSSSYSTMYNNIFEGNIEQKIHAFSPEIYDRVKNILFPAGRKVVKVFGEDCDITEGILEFFSISHRITLREIKNVKVKNLIVKSIKPEYVALMNNTEEKRREAKKAEIQAKYDHLREVYDDLGTKADKANLEMINELLYCEAEVLLDKIIDRISKQNNAKNMLLYKKYCEVASVQRVECN